MAFARDIGGASAVSEKEIIQIHGLTYHETYGIEGIALLQFGIPSFLYNKLVFTHIPKHTMAIRLPCHFDAFTHLQIQCAHPFAHKHATLALLALLQRHEVGIPIGIIQELLKGVERRKTRYTTTLHISPNTLDSRKGQNTVLLIPDLLDKL